MVEHEPTLRCSRCKLNLPVSRFNERNDCKRGYRHSCRECFNAYLREKRRTDPEVRKKSREYHYRWRTKNPGWWKEIDQRYKAKNVELLRERDKLKRLMKPEIARASNLRRKARKRNASGNHTSTDLVEIMTAQRGMCAYCRKRLKGRDYQVDHIQPLAKGGTNDRSNLQMLCGPCNHRKSAKDPIAFAQEVGLLL